VSQSLSLLLSLVLAVPVGVLTNLLTPLFARLLGRFNSWVRERLAATDRREERYVAWLATDPHARAEAFAHRRFVLLVQAIGTAMVLSVAVASLAQPRVAVAADWGILAVLSVAFYLLSWNLSKYLRIRLALVKRLHWPAWDLTVWSAERGAWEPIAFDPPAPTGQN
jgi:hypothetical protein